MPAIELPSADIPAEPRYIQIFTTGTVWQNGYHKIMSAIDIKNAKKVKTATVVSAGLLGGFITARESGIRLLGGVETTEQTRSEEHTSELQSRFDLVCRLLLEKKRQK